MKKYLFVLLIGFAITSFPLWSEETANETLVLCTVIYGNENDIPLNINSEKGWIDIGSINTEEINSLESPVDGVIRKWRVKSSYSDNTIAGQSTIQIRLRSDSSNQQIFTQPWSEGKKGWKENYSNWYQTDFNGQLPLLEEKTVSSVRLIAPPGSSSPGMIYKVVLEAWDITSSDNEENIQSIIQRAHVNTIPEIKVINREAAERKTRLEKRIPDRDQALTFALSFISCSLSGDLPAFYNDLNQIIYSLETGNGDSKYRIKPPQNYYSGFTLADYTANYETKIYDFNEYTGMFPQWINNSRKWKPDRNTYLFYGSALKEGKEALVKDELLVFMCKMIDGEWKLIAVPE